MKISNDIDKMETHIEKRTDPSLGVMYFVVHNIIQKFINLNFRTVDGC
ncbi:MAG: hypothetical protein JWM44_11 [Bacilli bacterium]|nr:hypothetical protein [Bacilli bacterium]